MLICYFIVAEPMYEHDNPLTLVSALNDISSSMADATVEGKWWPNSD